MQPQQQRTLSGVAYAASRSIDVGGGVKGNGLVEQTVLSLHHHDVGHLHAVLRERARLVGAYHGYGSHGLTSMELAHEVVALEHAPHVQGKGKRHSHGQALGHSHDDERHGHHEIFEHHAGHSHIVGGVPERRGEHVVGKEYDEGGDADGGAYLTYKFCQLRELHVQRCLHRRNLCGLTRHLAYLRCVAHSRDHSHAATRHDHR